MLEHVYARLAAEQSLASPQAPTLDLCSEVASMLPVSHSQGWIQPYGKNKLGKALEDKAKATASIL